MLYPQEVLEEVRMGNDIVDVISSYTALKQKGASYFGLCPFHKESTPSFSVSADKQLFHCFGCGASGNVYSFVMQIENYNFVDAVKFLADRIHYELPVAEYSQEIKRAMAQRENIYAMNKTAARFFYDNLNAPGGQTARTYLDARGVADKIRIKFGLGYSPPKRDALFKHLLGRGYDLDAVVQAGLIIPDKKGGYFDRFSGRLMFPIFDVGGRIVGFGGRIIGKGEPKYLNSPETAVFSKSRNLYAINFARLSRSREFILSEGYMDAISVYQAGFSNVVASLGTAFNTEHVKVLKKYADKVILLFDNDMAGTNAALRAIPILESGGLKAKVLQLSDAKDPDEYISRFGAKAFAGELERAQSSVSFRVSRIQDKFNLQDTDGNIRFTMEVAGLLAKIDSAVEREAYAGEISVLTGISQSAIMSEIDKASDKSVRELRVTDKRNMTYAEKNKLKEKGSYEAKKSLIYIAATNSGACRVLKECLPAGELVDDEYVRLLDMVYQWHELGQTIYPAEFVSRFENYEEQKLVSDIFNTMKANINSMESLEKSLNDLVRVVKLSYIEHISRTSGDVSLIRQLPDMKKNIEKLNITLSH